MVFRLFLGRIWIIGFNHGPTLRLQPECIRDPIDRMICERLPVRHGNVKANKGSPQL